MQPECVKTEQSNDISFDRPYGRYYNGRPARTADVTQYVGSGEFRLDGALLSLRP